MAEYLVRSEDLTTVADAIRTKGGTDAQLAFPGGFTAAIQSISSGGGLTVSGTNLHDVSTDTKNYYLEKGVETAYNNWDTTDYIPIEAGVVYAFFDTPNAQIMGEYCAKYNATKEYIENFGNRTSISANSQNFAGLWMSDVDGFIRFSGQSSTILGFAMHKCEGTVNFEEVM